MGMATTDQHIEESLSRAYVTAVAGMAGLSLSTTDFDYGVDGAVRDVLKNNGRMFTSPFSIDYQLKATINWTLDAASGVIIYDLEAKNYNDIASRGDDDPRLFLFLLCLPKDRSDWLNVGPDWLMLKKCCYWYTHAGRVSPNTSTVRIRIPQSNVLDTPTLRKLLIDERTRRMSLFS